MWTAAARDVSSRSPPPTTHERHLSIADSVVSITAEEIRERYRLSAHDHTPPPSSSTFTQPTPVTHPFRPNARRDSIFSFNTQWTADESFMDSTGMISDFPRPPAVLPGAMRFAPALASSLGHAPPSAWSQQESQLQSQSQTREPVSSASRYTDSETATPYGNSSFGPHTPALSSAISSSAHFHPSDDPLAQLPPPPPIGQRPHPRPSTAPSSLTVRTDRPYHLDPNSNALIEIVSGPSPTSPSAGAGARFPSPTSPARVQGTSPTSAHLSPGGGRSPTSVFLPPSMSSRSPTSPSSQYLVPTPSPTGRVPGFPVAPPSPATAAFLREPVLAPSTHASHEGLLDPSFIRTLMSGIEGGRDGLDLSLSGEEDVSVDGPFGDRYAVQEAYYEDLEEEEGGLPETPASSPFRRAPPTASLPSSPRSSFSFSVRSGVGKGWEDGEGDVPAVPPIPALYRQVQPQAQTQTHSPTTPPGPHTPPAPPTPASHATSFNTTGTGTLRPDWTSRRRSVESRRTGKETIGSGSGVSTATGGSGHSHSALSGISERSASNETAVVQHAALIRTASIAEMMPAVYTSTPGSPQHAGDERWSGVGAGSHARTTSADLLERAVRNRKSVQQLQFLAVTHPDARRSAAGGVGLREEEEEEEGDDLVYVRGDGSGRESGYLSARDSAYTDARGRDSTYTDTRGRDSVYLGAWAEPPSPNEMSPALRESIFDTTNPPRGMGMTAYGKSSASPSTAHATPGHSAFLHTPGPSSPPTPGYAGFGLPTTPGPGVQTFAALGPGEDAAAARRAKRVSTTSFVSSVFSKFSGQSSYHASAGHTSGARAFAFSWRGGGGDAQPPPLPTPSPHVARMWEAYNKASGSGSGAGGGSGTESTHMSMIVRREGTMELPALAERAEKLNEMLELGKLPYRSKSTLGPPTPRVVDVPVGVDHDGNDVYPTAGGFTGEKPPRRTRSLRSVLTSFSDRSRRFMGAGAGPNAGSSSLRSSIVDIPGQQNMRFNKLPEELRQQDRERKIQWVEGTGVKPERPLRRVVSRKKFYFFLAIAIFALVAIIAISVGLSQTIGRRKPDAGGFTCKATNQTGRLCDLDSSCVCTSSLAGQCNPLAGSIASLIDPVNRFFSPSPAFTAASVALSIWELQGSPLSGQNCANQADLIDVGPALSYTELGSTSANRTEFARSALLWTLVMSMDTNGTARMQEFIQGLDFSLLDGATASTVAGEFLFGAAGYQVDFGKLTVSQPAVTWEGAGKPSDGQVALVGGDVRAALDRVYTFAAASSAQRATALKRYWTNVLQFQASELDTFRSAASASPVLLPFDATLSNVRQLFSNVNQSFPPPAACYPGLKSDELSAINTLETGAFGLGAISSAPSTLDASCFQSRPVYGVLDLARLRTPFTSFVPGAPRQAVQISYASSSRVSVRLGRDLAGLPGTSISSANTTGAGDARTFGTLGSMDHVLLTYLQSFPSIQAAGALVEYVLGASDARAPPPSNVSALFNLTSSLEELPMLEVAFFGTVGPDDLSLAVADFADSGGELFFGSSDGDAFRTWAVQRAGSVVWGDGAMAQQVVREGAIKDQTFEEVWKGGSTLLSNAAIAGTKTSRSEVQKIVSAFGTIGYLGS